MPVRVRAPMRAAMLIGPGDTEIPVSPGPTNIAACTCFAAAAPQKWAPDHELLQQNGEPSNRYLKMPTARAIETQRSPSQTPQRKPQLASLELPNFKHRASNLIFIVLIRCS